MIFQTDHRQGTHDQRRVYALYEIIYTIIDFAAATAMPSDQTSGGAVDDVEDVDV